MAYSSKAVNKYYWWRVVHQFQHFKPIYFGILYIRKIMPGWCCKIASHLQTIATFLYNGNSG